MKLKLFSTLLFAGFISALSFAQNKADVDKATLSNDVVSKLEAKQFDMTTLNRPNQLNIDLTNNTNYSTNYTTRDNEDNGILPFARIEGQMWGSLNVMDSDALVYFSSEHVGTNFNVKVYDEEFNITDSFSVVVPESANRVQLLNHYSTDYFNDDATDEFMIFVNYFDPEIMGPEGHIMELWAIDSDGEKLASYTGNTAWPKVDGDGNKKMFTYIYDDNEGATISAYDVSDASLINTYTVSNDLLNFFMGSPADFTTIDGQEYLVVAHYESLFMDNMNMEVYPDNHLIVKLLDYDFEEVKTMTLNIESRFDLADNVIPAAEFGTFHTNADKNFNISTDIFNSDSKMEVLYSISYFHMMDDTEWTSLIVANEDGDIIHALDEYIIDINNDMVAIEGHDTQIGLLYGEYNAQATNLGFFDVESWEMVFSFEAMQGDDLLSNKYNRIPYEDTYHYLIGLGNSDVEDGNQYGVINEYAINGDLHKRHQLYLPENVELFEPIMGSNVFKENLFTTENDDLHFLYLYLERSEDDMVLNHLVIASDAENILAEFRGDGVDGNIVGAGMLLDANVGGTDSMYLQYEAGGRDILVDFYKLPLTGSLSVEDFINNSFSVYPNPSTGVINVASDIVAKDIKIYSMTGKLLHSQPLNHTQSTINIASLAQGIYVAHVSLEDGSMQKVKLIKQ